MKRQKWLPLMLGGILMFSACGLLPEEETFNAVPLIDTYEREDFEQAFAVRGDMELTQKVSCTYIPVQSETLAFKVGGEYFDEVYVEVGDSVKKGQLLAQLDLSGAQEAIDSCILKIEKLEMQLSALEENRTLEIKRQKILLGTDNEDALKETLGRINKQYNTQEQKIRDELTVARLQLKESETLRDERQLRAAFDGTVTYVRTVEYGERSVAGERFVTVADASTSLFRAETKLWKYFVPGDEHVITVSKTPYETVVVSEAELGLEESEKTEGKNAYVYLRLKNPAFELEEQDRGTLILLLDSRTDVLMIPEDAVASANGQKIVYYQTEEGMKAYKAVETGLAANDMIEIVSGLTEGESVIVE